jgi:hypothetical protein
LDRNLDRQEQTILVKNQLELMKTCYTLITRNLVTILYFQKLNNKWLSTIAEHKREWLNRARLMVLLLSLKTEILQLY